MKTYIGFRAEEETREKIQQIADATNHKPAWIARRIVEAQIERLDTTDREAARKLVAAIS